MKNKIFKKVQAGILLGTMSMLILSGCGNRGDGQKVNEANEGSGKVDKVIITYLTMGTDPADVDKVESAINEITIPEIGVEVEYKCLGITEAPTKYSTWIASNEPMDLMMLAFTDISSYINQGMIEPLDELITSNGAYISSLAEEYPLYDGAIVDEQIYGVSTVKASYGAGSSYMFKKSVLDQAGVEIEPGTMITIAELGEIFKEIKTKLPDVYPCGVTGAGNFARMHPIDILGSTVSSGALILDSNQEKVVDVFESDEYYAYLETMREWYTNGYIMKDAATTDISAIELLKSGTIAGVFQDGQPSLEYNMEANVGEDMVTVNLMEPYYSSSASGANTYWTIPVTCQNPEAAMKLLNLMFENTELCTLFQWGIEGEHYVVTDEEMGVIGFPEGIDGTNSGYYVPLGLYGNQREMYGFAANATQIDKKFTETALANPSKAVGFYYDATEMQSQLIAIDAVLNEYTATLETGSGDLEKIYPEFIDKLKANGIDEVVADKQAQYDEWMKSK